MNKRIFRYLAVIIATAYLSGCISGQADSESGSPVSEPSVSPDTEADSFIVSEELYKQTFDDVESLIITINELVTSQDYDGWLEYLTEDYIVFYSDPDYLSRISDDLLKSFGYRVRLRTLRDYFRYVVVNSRIDVKLDRIEFLDEHRIIAEAVINERPYILYYLEKKNGEWKIGKW